MKKLLAIIFATLILCPILAGCGKTKTQNLKDTNELTVYVDQINKINLKETLDMYKEAFSNVKLNVVDLSKLSYQEYQTKIKSDIQAGKGPDIIFIDPYTFDNVYKTIEAGAFCELDSIFKSDTKFKMSDYNKTVMDAGIFKGKRYIIPLFYSIPYLLTTQAILDKTKININNCNDYLGLAREIDNYIKKGNKDTRVFKDAYDIQQLALNYSSNILNYEDNTVNLDNKELKELITLSKYYYQQEVNSPLPNEKFTSTFDGYKFLKAKTKVFEIYSSGRDDEIFDNASTLVASNEKPIMLPIRTVDGKVQSQVSLGAAISNNSKNKKNAFNLIKIMLSDYVQKNERRTFDLPVRKESFDGALNNLSLRIKSLAYQNDSEMIFAELPDTYFDQYSNTAKEINSCKFQVYYPYECLIKYMTPFVKNEKSYEECIKNAKDQLQIYVSE